MFFVSNSVMGVFLSKQILKATDLFSGEGKADLCHCLRQIYAPCDGDGLLVDLSNDFRKKAPVQSPVVEVCFAPTPVAAAGEGFSAVLCTSRGPNVLIWHCLPTGTCHLLNSISLEKEDLITALDLSKSYGEKTQAMLVLGTNLGNIHFKVLISKSKKTDETRIQPFSISDASSHLETLNVNGCITDVVAFSDANLNGTDLLVAIAHGVRVSAVIFALETVATGQATRQFFQTSSPCHALPIVSLACDTVGVFANDQPSATSASKGIAARGNVLSLDSSGQAVIWHFSEGVLGKGGEVNG